MFWNKANLPKMTRSEDSLNIAFNLGVVGKNENKVVQLNAVDIKLS
ncbi:hypothetical protein [Candidatus Endomicrobiellum agilis]|nr:hypothetical protein [Endomicrobium sp.]MDR3092724.1 hypothetical protein [Endomicrobium sp.]